MITKVNKREAEMGDEGLRFLNPMHRTGTPGDAESYQRLFNFCNYSLLYKGNSND